MDCLHKLCSYICKNVHKCPIEFKTNAPFEMKIYKLNSTKESPLAISTHMEKNPFGMAYPFTSKELETYVKTVPKEDLQWVFKTFKKFPKTNNTWAEYINKKKYAKPLWIVAILLICKAYEESNGKMTSSCPKNFKKILQEGAAPSQPQYLDEDAIEELLRTEFKKGKKRTLTYKDIMSVASMSKEMHRKSKKLREDVKEEFELKKSFITKVIKELEEIPKTTSGNHYAMFALGNVPHASHYFSTSNSIAATGGNDLYNVSYYMKRDLTQEIYNQIRQVRQPHSLSVDISFSDANELQYYLRFNFVLSKEDGTTINMISISFIDTLNRLVVLYMYEPTLRLHIDPNIIENPDKEFIYTSMYTILGFLDFLITKYDLNQLTTNEQKQNTIRLQLLDIKEKTLDLLPSKIGFIEGGKKQIGKGPEDVFESMLRKDFTKGKDRTLTYKDLMSMTSMSKDMYLKSKPLRSDIKKDFDLKQSYIIKVIKEFEKVPQTFLTAPLSTTTNNNLPNSFYNTNHSANRIGSTSMEVINISYYFKKELTEDIYNYIQNEYSGFHTLRGEPYNSAKLFPYYLTFNFQYNIENNKVRDYSLNIMFMTSTRLHLPLYNYQTIPLPRLYIHNSILQNPTEEFMYVSIYTILGYLDFIIKTFDFNKLTHNELLQNTIRQIFIDIKKKTLDLLPSKIGIIEGGTGLTPAVCDPIVTYLTKDFAKGTGRKFSNADCMAFLKTSKVAYTTDKTFKTKIINAKRIENIQNMFEKIHKKSVTETQFKPKNISYYVLVEPKNVGRHTTYRSSNLKYKAFTVMFYVTCKSSTNNKYFWFTFTLSDDDGISINHLQCNLYENDNVITLFNYATLFDLSYDMYIEPSLSSSPNKELCNASIYTILGFIQFLSQSFDLSQLVKDKEKQEQIKFNLLAVKQNVMNFIK